MVTEQPWGEEFGSAFRAGYEEPPTGGVMPVPPVGWRADDEPLVMMLCDLEGRPVVELPVSSVTVNAQLNAPSEATFSVFLPNYKHLDSLLLPWQQTVVALVNQTPVWGGTVVKRRGPLGAPDLEVTARCWSAWLDRVWATPETEYVQVVEEDAGLVIWKRMKAAASLAGNRTPLGALIHAGHAGVLYDGDFEDQTEETSPQTFLSEIQTVQQTSGCDWRIAWLWATDRYVPQVRTEVFNPDATASEVVVGVDVGSAKYDVDTDGQANLVKVIGEDEARTAVDPVSVYPPLWTARSFDKVVDPTKLSQRLLAGLKDPILSVTDVTIPGCRDEHAPGEVMRVVVPQGYDARYPRGVETSVRVTGVTWTASAAARTTAFSTASLFDSLANVPQRGGVSGFSTAAASPAPAPLGFVETLRAMEARLTAVELRRTPVVPVSQIEGEQ